MSTNTTTEAAVDTSNHWTLACTAVLEMVEEPVKDVEWVQRVEDHFMSTSLFSSSFLTDKIWKVDMGCIRASAPDPVFVLTHPLTRFLPTELRATVQALLPPTTPIQPPPPMFLPPPIPP